jgi:hypothetical protein
VNTRADAVRAAQARGWLEPPAAGEVVLDMSLAPAVVGVEL